MFLISEHSQFGDLKDQRSVSTFQSFSLSMLTIVTKSFSSPLRWMNNDSISVPMKQSMECYFLTHIYVYPVKTELGRTFSPKKDSLIWPVISAGLSIPCIYMLGLRVKARSAGRCKTEKTKSLTGCKLCPPSAGWVINMFQWQSRSLKYGEIEACVPKTHVSVRAFLCVLVWDSVYWLNVPEQRLHDESAVFVTQSRKASKRTESKTREGRGNWSVRRIGWRVSLWCFF